MEHLFETYLTQRKLSPNTIKSYNYSRELFFSLYPRLTQRNLEQYKLYLLETYRPQTVNLRIRGINCYLEICGKDHWKLPFIKKQQKPFLENVISEAERFNDLALLADLLGHENIETTRIYLRRSSREQREVIDQVVNW